MGDTIRYTAMVDSFSTSAQGQIGLPQPAQLPAEISGILDPPPLEVDSVISDWPCNTAQTSLRSDVRNLLINFPAQLSPGTSWRDSTIGTACYGTLPIRAAVFRIFTVTGGAPYNGQATVTIQRRDSISAYGEGREQQHRLSVEAAGTGSATYYLSLTHNSVLRLTMTQNLDFTVRASGRASRFRETAKQEFSLLR